MAFDSLFIQLNHFLYLLFPSEIFEGVVVGKGAFGFFAFASDLAYHGFCEDFVVIDGHERTDGIVDEVG
jgi:hypothetical protein